MRAIFGLVILISFANADDKEELAALGKQLKHKDVKVRLKAVADIEAKGELAHPIARELCGAILDKDQRVAKASLAAIEKVAPQVYKPLCLMLLNKGFEDQSRGIGDLGLLKEFAAPAIDIIIAKERILQAQILARPLSERASSAFFLRRNTMLALEKISPDDDAVVKFYRDSVATENKHDAIGHLLRWAGDKEDRRKSVYPHIKAAVREKPNQATTDYVKWTGEYGKMSKDLLPVLKELKLNSDQNIRDAAADAVAKIEQALKE